MLQEPSTPRIVVDDLLPALDDVDLRRAAQVARVVDGLASGMTITHACNGAGISIRTWQRWKKEGFVQELIAERFDDVMAGVRKLVAEALPSSTNVLVAISQGKIPPGTAIDGTLAPRDVVAAQQQLMALYRQVGGDMDPVARDNEKAVEALRTRAVSITTYNIETVNVGTDVEPMPVPSRAINVIDVTPALVEEG
jgi:hypothetical protein